MEACGPMGGISQMFPLMFFSVSKPVTPQDKRLLVSGDAVVTSSQNEDSFRGGLVNSGLPFPSQYLPPKFDLVL